MELGEQWELALKELRPLTERFERDNSRLVRLMMGAGASVYGALAEEFDDSCGATYVSGSTTGSPDPVINFNGI